MFMFLNSLPKDSVEKILKSFEEQRKLEKIRKYLRENPPKSFKDCMIYNLYYGNNYRDIYKINNNSYVKNKTQKESLNYNQKNSITDTNIIDTNIIDTNIIDTNKNVLELNDIEADFVNITSIENDNQ